MKCGANNMYDELLSIELKKSPMWEINNPRVNILTRDLLAFIFESCSFKKEQRRRFSISYCL